MTASPAAAIADPGDACVTSYETAQQAHKKGELVRAKANLRMCTAACPAALAADCERWLGDVKRSLSYLTIAARDEAGNRLLARLTVDSAERGLEQPLELDPGKHRVDISLRGYQPISTSIDLRAGASDSRSFTMRVDSNTGAAAADDASVLGPVLLGSGGLLTLVVAGALTLVGHLDVSEMRETCAPRCDRERVDRVGQYWTAGGVLAGVGGAALVASSVWLGVTLAPPTSDGTATTAGLSVRFAF